MARPTTPLPLAELPDLTGSPVLDPWRVRLRLGLLGDPEPPSSRPPTQSELLLWDALQVRQEGWVREHSTGRYRLDFYLPTAKLAVEVDGSSHWGRVRAAEDQVRDVWHRDRGITTLRVSADHVVRDVRGVLRVIDERLAGPYRLPQVITVQHVDVELGPRPAAPAPALTNDGPRSGDVEAASALAVGSDAAASASDHDAAPVGGGHDSSEAIGDHEPVTVAAAADLPVAESGEGDLSRRSSSAEPVAKQPLQGMPACLDVLPTDAPGGDVRRALGAVRELLGTTS